MRPLHLGILIVSMLFGGCFAETTDSNSRDDSPLPNHTGSTGSIIDRDAVSLPTPATSDDNPTSEPALGSEGTDLGLGQGDLTVLLVFDKSGSMADKWDDKGKWQIASDALLRGMDGVLDALTIGAILFPQPFDCQVEPLDHQLQMQFTSGRRFVERWTQTVAVENPTGSTPLGLAFEMADRAIQEARELGLLQKRFRVVVVTDGEPNCGTNPESLVQSAAAWRELGVETHVLGLPGSQTAADLLDRIAHGGGTEEHVSAGSHEEVEDTLHAAVR